MRVIERSFKALFLSILLCFTAGQMCLAATIFDVSQLQSFRVVSIDVNAHSRDIHCATVAPSVESIDIVLADGQLVHACREENAQREKYLTVDSQ